MRGLVQNRIEDWLYEVAWRAESVDAVPASSLPSPREIASRLREQRSVSSDIGGSVEIAADLDRLSDAYIVRAFDDLGWKPWRGDRFTTAHLAQELGINARQLRLFDRLLAIAADVGMLRGGSPEWECCHDREVEEPARLLDRLSVKHHEHAAELTLLSRCGPHLAAVLRGATNPLDLIFPGGSLATTEQFYEQSPFARDANKLVHRRAVGPRSGTTAGR